MRIRSAGILAAFVLFTGLNSFGQNYGSVGLDDEICYILEQCETRGLCSPLPPVRPWTRGLVLARIDEVLENAKGGVLGDTERQILEYHRGRLGDVKPGLDLFNGTYSASTEIGRTGVEISGTADMGLDIEASTGLYSGDESYYGMDLWVNASLAGDIGRHVSYGLSFSGGILRVPREKLGTYHTYYDRYDSPSSDDEAYSDREIDSFSQPLTHFPYSYKKKWDSSVYFFNELSIYNSWPIDFAGVYNLRPEISASFLDDRLFLRAGQFEHDWGVMPSGSSLALNQAARPFLGIEGSFAPLSWFSVSTLTGVLEYFNERGIKDSSMPNQNAFSISMFNFRYKDFLFIDIGESVVWPKRFELGYMLPFVSSFFYQGGIGDFDNLAMFFNIKARYPGLGDIWFSLFLDEASLEREMLFLDRTMISYHGGLRYSLPWLPFASLKLTYTKVEPYCYTHTTIDVPWYRVPMEEAYTNNGVGLGYYLPPNTDEILLRFEAMPWIRSSVHFQYQMIRHGADYGSSAVDGSSLLSELDPSGRSSNPVLRKYFLHDGAYQWSHVLKIGGGHSFNTRVPFRITAEAGVVFSQFSNIDGPPNVGSSSSYHMVDTTEYPRQTGFIFTLGLRIFPK